MGERINSLLQHQHAQDTQIRLLREKQKNLFASPTNEDLRKLYVEEKELFNQLEQELQALDILNAQTLLTPGELHRVDYLRNEFQLQMHQLQLYIHEIEQLNLGQVLTKPIASLVIARQPFPNVPSKGSQLGEDELVVQLLTGASTVVSACSAIKGIITTENTQGRANDEKAISGNTQPLDHSLLKAKFPITFEEGTRRNAARMRFIVEVQLQQMGHTTTGTLESVNNSSPFVVMTNQKQWEGCEKTLLLRDAFGSSLEISWLQFANALQRQFIRATRQEPQNNSRCLSSFDFAYLHDKFLANRNVFLQREYEAFWNWYGKCIQVIRYQRHIGQLWQEGLLYGFMTREEVDMALSGEPPGTFVLRFSERHAGQIGIAYVGAQVNSIKHYLVQPNDTAASKVTLPDFLREKPQFAHMLQFTLLPTGVPQFRRLPKDQVLGPLYSRRAGGDTTGTGYDPLV